MLLIIRIKFLELPSYRIKSNIYIIELEGIKANIL